MRPSHILVRATAVASAALLAACAGRDVTAPDLGASGGGTHLLVPSDGPSRDMVTADGQPIIRIGVVPSANTVTLGSGADYVVKDKASGLVLFSGHAGSVSVTLLEANTPKYRLQVVCGSTAAVQALQDAAEAQGVVTYTEYVPTAHCTRVFLGEFASNASFSIRNAFRNQMIAAGLSGTDSFWKIVTPAGGAVYGVSSGGTSKQSLNPVTVTSSDGIVTINGSRYRGLGEARINSQATLAGINELPLEQYLYGVVPRELGPIAYPEMEAQKAQAIVARTYAISGLGKRASDGYDLTATTSDQVYGGYDDEYALSNQAVDETRGRVVTYGGHLISTLYFSTSGGHTADNEEAFNGAPAAYLRGVPDAERGNAFEHVPTLAVFMSHANPMSLRATKEGDYESDWSRYHRWTFEWNADEISSVVSAFAGQDVGRVLAINALERGPSGRVQRLEFVTDAGSFYATKDGIRAALKYYNASHVATNLPSTLFFIEPVTDRRTKEVTGFAAYGGGFGHGVGLSQTGAVGMAQKGHTVDEILHHYYQGIELASQY
jgi:peptidoglycan hydrolase-like amidase